MVSIFKMPNSRQSHDQNLDIVYLVCLQKADRGISLLQKNVFAKHVFSDFEAHKDLLPRGICTTCRHRLASMEGPNPRQIPTLQYDQLVADQTAFFWRPGSHSRFDFS